MMVMQVTKRDLDKARQLAGTFMLAAKAKNMSEMVAALDAAERKVAETLALWRELGKLENTRPHQEGAD
jgi:hypothetical protein